MRMRALIYADADGYKSSYTHCFITIHYFADTDADKDADKSILCIRLVYDFTGGKFYMLFYQLPRAVPGQQT